MTLVGCGSESLGGRAAGSGPRWWAARNVACPREQRSMAMDFAGPLSCHMQQGQTPATSHLLAPFAQRVPSAAQVSLPRARGKQIVRPSCRPAVLPRASQIILRLSTTHRERQTIPSYPYDHHALFVTTERLLVFPYPALLLFFSNICIAPKTTAWLLRSFPHLVPDSATAARVIDLPPPLTSPYRLHLRET